MPDLAPLTVTVQQTAPIPLDVSLECKPGELVALVGPSGAGKTTVLRAIAGLYRPSAGRISCGGETWFDSTAGIMVPPQARRAGLVFQDYALFPHLSARDNVRLAMHHVAEPERSVRANALLARVHLDGLESRTPDRLSGGQRQRVAIARALARDPKVLLLDEPFSAVDRMTREALKDELANLRRSLDIPIVLVTHDLAEAQALADRISVIDKGRTLQAGGPDDVRLRPHSATVARLMGQTNVFEGTVDEAAVEGRSGRLRWGATMLEVAVTGAFRAGDRVAWVIPSDYIAFADGNGKPVNVAAATIADIISLGEMVTLRVHLEWRGKFQLRFNVPAREVNARALVPGSQTRLQLLPAGIHLMASER
jgi:molybdate transport system ATP-binding protein